MKKFPIKIRFLILGILILSIGLFNGMMNIGFWVNKSKLTDTAERLIYHKIQLQQISYIFPNFIVLKNLVISPSDPSPEDQSIFFPKIMIRFSFWRFLTQSSFSLSYIELYNLKIFDDKSYSLTRNLTNQILEYIKQLPKNKMKLNVNNASLRLNQKDDQLHYLTLHCSLKTQEDSIISSGTLKKDYSFLSYRRGRKINYTFHGKPFQYTLKGLLTTDGFFIKSLEITKENVFMQLWGSASQGEWQLKGYSFLKNHPMKSRKQPSPKSPWLAHLNPLPSSSWANQDHNQLTDVRHYLLDIDSCFKIANDFIEIKQLNLSLNKIPIQLKGLLYLSTPLKFDVLLSIFPNPWEIKGLENIKQLDLSIQGTMNNKMISSVGTLDLFFTDHLSGRYPIHKIKFNFKELISYYSKYPHFALYLKEGTFLCCNDKPAHQLSLQNFKASVNWSNDKYKYIEYYSPFYDGFLTGRLGMETHHAPFQITTTASLANIDLNQLKELFPHFKRVNGRLDSLVYFTNYPTLDFRGRINLQKVQLNDPEFYHWLNKYVGFSTLKPLDIANLSSNFLVNPQSTQFHDIEMKSKEMDLQGDFSVDNNDLVQSQFSLGMAKNLINKFPNFKPLLKIIESNADSVKFDFELSGNVNTLNFQWSPSELKNKIEEKIPNFIQRRIERQIENLIENNLEK